MLVHLGWNIYLNPEEIVLVEPWKRRGSTARQVEQAKVTGTLVRGTAYSARSLLWLRDGSMMLVPVEAVEIAERIEAEAKKYVKK